MTLQPSFPLGALPGAPAATPAGAPSAATPAGTLSAAAPSGATAGATWRARYLSVLTWAFTLFSSARLVSYLPTLWAIAASGDSSQHSLWTWGIWFGSNVTMALWLFEQHGQRWTRAALVNTVNAAMCAATFTVILVFRF
jgi:hypothetical protein